MNTYKYDDEDFNLEEDDLLEGLQRIHEHYSEAAQINHLVARVHNLLSTFRAMEHTALISVIKQSKNKNEAIPKVQSCKKTLRYYFIELYIRDFISIIELDEEIPDFLGELLSSNISPFVDTSNPNGNPLQFFINDKKEIQWNTKGVPLRLFNKSELLKGATQVQQLEDDKNIELHVGKYKIIFIVHGFVFIGNQVNKREMNRINKHLNDITLSEEKYDFIDKVFKTKINTIDNSVIPLSSIMDIEKLTIMTQQAFEYGVSASFDELSEYTITEDDEDENNEFFNTHKTDDPPIVH